LPDDVRQKLEAAFTEATKDKAVVDLMNQRGLNNYVKIGDDLAAALKNHAESYKKMIQETAKK
jgi:tripartite-type tricarboxylate transporter receptor subunit TctC